MGLTTTSGPAVAVLAIDAGNSKTDAAFIGLDGRVLGTARGGGFQPPVVGLEQALDALAVTVHDAAAAAGIPADGPLARHVSACLANVDMPEDERNLSTALAALGWGQEVRVRNDTFAVLRAGVDQPRGIAVVCGAGINCVGMTPDGRTARFPALGKISGDWGGGEQLTEEALWFAARAADGRGEPTLLAEALPAHFALGSMRDLIEALHLGRIDERRKPELTPVLFAVATAGDRIAQALVTRQADEVVALAVTALGQLDLLEEATDVVLGGSVLAARHPQLDEGIRERLSVRAPKALPRVVTAPPVLGAALLGLEAVDAPAASLDRLRRHYA